MPIDRTTRSINVPSRISLGWSPFHTAANDYYKAGFLPIPLPGGKKYPPPKGIPNDIAYSQAVLDGWLEDNRERNIGCIVPDGCVVFDIDGPAAREALIELENALGILPPTWMSFRGNPDRYHLWFTVPNNLRWPGKLGPGIDIIYRHYRYMVLPPSIHPDGGQYRWANFRKDKLRVSNGYFPSPDEFTDLPENWLQCANGNGYVQRDRASVDCRLWIVEYGDGEPCSEMKRTLVRHQRIIRQHNDPGGLHDCMINGVWAILAEVSTGHTGGLAALKRFKNTFIDQIEESGRRETGEAAKEWSRACIGAIEKTAVERVRTGDPCIIEESERGKDPSRFFDAKYGFRARSLRRSIELTGKLAVGPGRIIYRNVDGLWTPDGESEIYRRTERLLGQRYRPSHATNVLSVVSNREPIITDDNQDTTYLNLPNGLLDWKEGKLYPHNPNVISTIRLPIVWDDEAECPDIDQFFSEVFPNDAIEFAYEILGYMLFNDNPLHKAILLYGSGRNGKGTFLRLARMLVGHNNISAVTPQALDSSQFSSAQLYGKLANLVGDVDPRIFKSTEQFKQLTGGDYMMAQHKHRDPFVFRCRALMIAAFNALPRSADTTEGFFSRWLVVPFSAFFPAGVADPMLITRLCAPRALQGLLRNAVGGLQAVMRRGGFQVPASVQRATNKFKLEADPLRGFISERVEHRHPNAAPFVARAEFYNSYTTWATINGFHQMAANRFYESLLAALVDEQYGVRAITNKGVTGYRGIVLR